MNVSSVGFRVTEKHLMPDAADEIARPGSLGRLDIDFKTHTATVSDVFGAEEFRGSVEDALSFLMERYPRLYLLTMTKNCGIAEPSKQESSK